MEKKAKQVIVMRKDLNMRKGKMVTQGSHASLGAYLLIVDSQDQQPVPYRPAVYEAWLAWITGTFTKVCVGVEDESELLNVYNEAIAAKLPAKLVVDAGHTEFHGVPTRTCLAIGPAWEDEVDAITSKLKLL